MELVANAIKWSSGPKLTETEHACAHDGTIGESGKGQPMRIPLMLATLALAACSAPQGPDADTGAKPVRAAGQVEAEQACAGVTGRTDGADAMREEEYRNCIAAVIKGDTAAPALRGRTDAPT